MWDYCSGLSPLLPQIFVVKDSFILFNRSFGTKAGIALLATLCSDSPNLKGNIMELHFCMDTVGILIPLEWQLSSTKTQEHPKLKFFASLLWSVGSLGFRISTNIVGLFLKKKKKKGCMSIIHGIYYWLFLSSVHSPASRQLISQWH